MLNRILETLQTLVRKSGRYRIARNTIVAIAARMTSVNAISGKKDRFWSLPFWEIGVGTSPS